MSGWYICVCYWLVLQGNVNYAATFLTGKNTFWVSYSSWRIAVKQCCSYGECCDEKDTMYSQVGFKREGEWFSESGWENILN